MKPGKKLGYLYSGFEAIGDWQDGIEHYAGIQFKIDDNIHYGWVRLQVLNVADHVLIKDYAYNMVPGEAIQAGEFLECADGFEPNNNFKTAAPVETGHNLSKPGRCSFGQRFF